MAANHYNYKIIVWERSNKLGKWLPYSPDVCKHLEENFKKNVANVSLGDVDKDLKIYSVNFNDMMQVSEVTGMFVNRIYSYVLSHKQYSLLFNVQFLSHPYHVFLK